jgi:putative flippase GtrA
MRRLYPVLGQLVRYALVVSSGYVLAIAIYSGELAIGISPYPALGVAFVLGGAYNFTLVRRWAFSPSGRGLRSDLTRFCGVAAMSFVCNYASFAILYSVLELPAETAQRLAILIAGPVTFLGNRFWSFRASGIVPVCHAGEQASATSARNESYSRI